jgi:hypothetical protein
MTNAATPRPRGGMETDWWAESVKLYRRLRKVERAAQAVVDETQKIHDGSPWPLKYRAPYGAITELIKVLSEQPTIDAKKRAALAISLEPNAATPTCLADWVEEMRDNYGDPNGSSYEQGVWDQSQRILPKLRSLEPNAPSIVHVGER